MQSAYFSTSLFIYSTLQLIRDPKSFQSFAIFIQLVFLFGN